MSKNPELDMDLMGPVRNVLVLADTKEKESGFVSVRSPVARSLMTKAWSLELV